MSQSHKAFVIVLFACALGAGAYMLSKWYPKYSAKKDLDKLGITYSEQQFIDHACAGDTGTVLLFLRTGVEINVSAVPSKQGPIVRTALQCSIMTGHLDTATALVNMGANVNKVDAEGSTPLYYLARYSSYLADTQSRLSLAELLIAKGANVAAAGKWGTPLMGSILSGSAEITDLLIRHGADVKVATSEGITPLIALAKNSSTPRNIRNIDLMKRFVDMGADVNFISKSGDTALTFAVQRRDKNMVTYLLSKGADPNKPDGNAAKLISYTLQDMEMLQLLLQNGVDVNAKINEETLLHYFINRKNDVAIQTLFSYKELNVNAVDTHGDTPLHIAAYRGSEPLVKQLVESGANINARNISMQTPLMKAVIGLSIDTTEELIRDGADVNAPDINGHTALYYASKNRGNVMYDPRIVMLSRALSARDVSSAAPIPPSQPTAADRKKATDTIVSILRKHGAK